MELKGKDLFCPVCKMENLPDATHCAFCQAPLGVEPPTGMITEEVADLPADTIGTWIPRPVDIQVREGIVIYVGYAGETIMIEKKSPFILGRNVGSSRGANGEEIIDLTDFDAYDKGVSRQHVVIIPLDDGYAIKDLGSTNGTWLNQSRLIPGRYYPLSVENEVRLGHLFLRVFAHPPKKGKK